MGARAIGVKQAQAAECNWKPRSIRTLIDCGFVAEERAHGPAGAGPWLPLGSHRRRSRCPDRRPGYLPAVRLRSVSILSTARLTSRGFLVAKYQSIVRRRPLRNMMAGSHPSKRLAKALSATRFMGPVGISGWSSIFARWPV